MKKIATMAIIFSLFFGLVYYASAYFIKDQENIGDVEIHGIIQAFEISESRLLEYNTNTTLSIPDTFWSIEEMRIIKKDLIKAFELNGQRKDIINYEHHDPYFIEDYEEIEGDVIYSNEIQEEGYRQITLTAIENSGKISVIILQATEFDGEKEAHIIVDIVQNKEYKGIVETCNQSEGILSKYGMDMETTIIIVGTYDEEIETKAQLAKLEEVLHAVMGQKVEQVQDEHYTMLTGYTSLIPQAIQYDGKTVNLQLAMRYNSYENRTYLWIATPLITTTY
ncbi:hypothetical protein Amet_0357 [Alkaliphilus metalliredigens QYMF]|uniref:TATA-box binding protein n=1 Tax=Alkaliphilus metalliredigens (strain QYMF) TaxID=293826 RepID=A6TK69_ALKMQ|nr:YwmB family TATA-box binding protein [Alkaliphilus metalliredigens]ABR46587.1 hypothetical protein Amet_0357 [Alkaliphilus metalliredigens QYMF]